ncbi:Gamma-aminobutyric acid type B receptor subunit 2 [Geodia barretti]|nr:Gamma-aminobutyric acid type B receptor subunit 2 [Geodia barretti]
MLGELDESGVSVHHQLILDSAPKLLPPDTHTLFGEDVKVFVLNMSPLLAKAVLCWALRDLTYPGYAWITYGWYGERWWEEGEEDSVSCTAQQLAVYLERSLAVSHYPTWTVGEGSGTVTDQPTCLKSGLELTNELLLRAAPPTTPPPGLRSPLPPSVYLVYDAVWTAALAHTTAPLSRYPETVDKVSFEGSSGLVSFGNGTRELFQLTLFQYRRVNGELQRVTVASLTPLEDSSHYDITFNEGETPATVWPNGVPPDGTPIQVEHFPYPALMGIVYTYSLLGVLFALGCLAFNLVFRKRKLIRLTSPNLNNIIVLGAIVLYLAGLAFFYPQGASRTGIIWGCNLRAWTAALGFSACYGTLNVKMWRVYSICRNPRPSMSKSLIKDYHLVLLVLGFVMVDTITLVVITSLDNSRFTVITIPNKQDPTPRINEEGIKEVSVVSRCLSTTEPYWLSILFGYKAIIQAIGLYLAFKIRNIKIRGLNDSREVSITLYISSMILFIVVVVTFVYGDYIDVDGFVYGFGLSTCATVVLSLTFITKMVNLYRDPEGKDIFQAPTSTDADPGTDIYYLQRRVRELEKQVELARSQENLLDIGTPKSLSIAPPPMSSSTNTPPSTSDSVTTSRAQAPSDYEQ